MTKRRGIPEKSSSLFRVGVLGAGTWGIALANMLAKNQSDVIVWSALSDEVLHLQQTHIHPQFPDVTLCSSITYECDLCKKCEQNDVLLLVVPSPFIRQTAHNMAPFVRPEHTIVIATKGIEERSLRTMSEVVIEECSEYLPRNEIHIAALSGPTHAEEVIEDYPTTIVSASDDITTSQYVQQIFMNKNMRVYTNTDIRGVELCGAIKNVIALGVGISAGLGFGDNARAALITRGMEEIKQLGKKMGCAEQTFYGLAGIGDLIVTASSENSRNFRAGRLIGKGVTVQQAVEQIGMVVEGINALRPALQLAEKYGVDTPICQAVDSIVNHAVDPKKAAERLMMREKKAELDKSLLTVNYENILLQGRKETSMKRVITYGTFDMLHYGHINLLKRAKALGDYLVVVLSTDEFNWREKQKKCYFTYEQRKSLLEAIRYVDLVIPEESWDQKKTDVHEYHIDTFVIGDDWKGKFDFLKEEGVEVVYLPRTPEISTTQIKNDLHEG